MLLCPMVGMALLPAGATASGGGITFAPNSNTSGIHGGGGWNEPSGAAASDGSIYASFQNAQSSAPYVVGLSRSTDGRSWSKTGFSSSVVPLGDNFGDVTMTSDRSGTVFLGFIDQVLQAEVTFSRDGGKTWAPATDVANLPAAPSSSPFAVDRPWIAAYSPDSDFHHTQLFLEYHDFAPSFVWVVTCSMSTGALSCGAPVPVSDPGSFCNTIPGGVAISPAGGAHPGRVFAVWSTADPVTNAASGCNITQLAPFYTIDVAWSDAPATPGSWTVTPVYVGPHGSGENCPGTSPVEGVSTDTCADASEIFTQIATDGAGGAYVAFVDYIDTLDKHYDVYLASSPDGGVTWDGRKDGSGQPHRVSSSGTHFFPVITAGDKGRVDLAYIGTAYADTPFQAGSACPSGVPPQTSCQGKAQPEPPSTAWYPYLAQSLDADSATPTFTEVRASDRGTVIHYGDVCNLGIYCDGSATGNRSLWDTISVFTDQHGFAQVLWTDQRADHHGQVDAAQANAMNLQAPTDQVFEACQLTGPSLLAHPGGGSLCAAKARVLPFTQAAPGPSPLVPLGLVLLGALLLGGALKRARTRAGQ